MNRLSIIPAAAVRLYLGLALLISLAIALPIVAAYMVTIAPVVAWNDRRQRRASGARRLARMQLQEARHADGP